MISAPGGYRIEPASPDSVSALPDIEIDAADLFAEEDLARELRQEGFPESFFVEAAREGRLFVAIQEATNAPVGFALATLVDGSAHLFEMDVRRAHGRRGLGRALVEAVMAWAKEVGHPSITLTTFRHVPWNAPFYATLGFEEVAGADLTPELGDHLRREAEHGLDPAKRLAMRLRL